MKEDPFTYFINQNIIEDFPIFETLTRTMLSQPVPNPGKAEQVKHITLQGGCRTIVSIAGCIFLRSEAPECIACSVPTIACSS